MSKITRFFENILHHKKEAAGPSLPNLLKLNDFQDIYNYFTANIKYYLSIKNETDGFNKEVNKPNWVVLMCEDFHKKINDFRISKGKMEITLWDVFSKEELATSQTDYPLKFALFCTELCLN